MAGPAKRFTVYGVVVVWIVILQAARVTEAALPYPASTVITSVSWNWGSHVSLASGSDNWPITWADDDNQYSCWGDGGGFGGTNTDGRVSLGFARIEGAKNSYVGHNVWGGKNPENPATFAGKSYGILCIEGVLYALVNLQDGCGDCARCLCKSTNHGATWTQLSLTIPAGGGDATFLQFGKNYAGARDNYVYIYAAMGEWATGGTGAWLGRVPKDKIETWSAWEFYTGMSGGKPTWTSSYSGRRAVFEDARVSCVSVTYNAGLGRYLLCSSHKDPLNDSGLGIFDAPEPWGPWTTVAYYDDWGGYASGGSSFSYYFSNKWTSSNGLESVLVWSGTGSHDCWNALQCTFTTHTAKSPGAGR